MTTLSFSKAAILAVSLGLVVTGSAQAAGHSKKASKKPAQAAASQPNNSAGDIDSVKAQVKLLEKSLAVADAKAVAAKWTADGSYTNEEGQKWTGRSSLEDRFAAVFGSDGRQLVELAPENVKLVAPSVALVEGVVRRRDFAMETPATRFNMLLLKQADGGWLISTATETPYSAQEQTDHLKDLAWLIGDWKVEKNGGYVHLNANWTAGKKFMVLSYIIKRPGQNDVVDCKQVIGWNPRTEHIVSWSFDATGGFGYSTWNKNNAQWTVEADGVDSNGSSTRATNVVTPDGPNAFTWQSLNRSVDDAPVGDTAVLRIERAAN